MLIPSQRHRPDDLALWAELETADRIHGRQLLKASMFQRSLDTLREYAAAEPCYVSCSGGKDSTALLGLVAIAGLTLPAVWFRAMPKHNPDVSAVLTAAQRILGLSIDVVDYESPMPVRMTRAAAEAIACRNFLAASAEYARTHGRRIIGVRADESHVRRLKMRRWGLSTENSCTPLGWWTANDVFGFLAVRELPVHPVYAMLGAGRWDRTNLRVDALSGERGEAFGGADWEQEYYGDVLRRLECTAPSLTRSAREA